MLEEIDLRRSGTFSGLNSSSCLPGVDASSQLEQLTPRCYAHLVGLFANCQVLELPTSVAGVTKQRLVPPRERLRHRTSSS